MNAKDHRILTPQQRSEALAVALAEVSEELENMGPEKLEEWAAWVADLRAAGLSFQTAARLGTFRMRAANQE